MKFLLKLTKYLFLLFVAVFIIVVGIFIYYSQKLNFELPNMVDVQIYDRHGTPYLTLNNEHKQSYVQLDEVSEHMIDAIISIEDKKFYKHNGVDVMRIGGALVENIKSNDIREGASTITQQYARLLYLNPDQSVERKLEEIMIAMNIESKYSKDQILEGYLNSIYFDHGIYGIRDASKFYFNKEPSSLTIAEACVLASIPKGPRYYSPLNNPENNEARKNLIISELLDDGKITRQQANEARNEEIKFYGRIDKTNDYNAPYYQDMIIKELHQLKILERYEVEELNIYTSLDLQLTHIMLDAIDKYYPQGSNLQIALYGMDPNNGEVLSVIGGTDYTETTFNRAHDAVRQPGSVIKPFLYYAALNHGFTPITTFNSSQTDFYVDGKLYAPSNFADIYPNQDVTMAYAIATSDNIYAVKTHLFLGTSTLVNTLKEFGFTTPILNTPSLALGTSEVRLSEITTGYARFANLGYDVKPIYITKITDEKGNILYTNYNRSEQKYNQTNLYLLTETMTNVFDNRLRINISTTGAPIANMLTRQYAAKTGTTDYDSWILGYNPDLALGIWCGYDDSSNLEPSDSRFIKYLWAEIMENYLDGRPANWYKDESVVKIKVNPITGKLAQTGEFSKELYFDANNIPWYIFEEQMNQEDTMPPLEEPPSIFDGFLWPDIEMAE